MKTYLLATVCVLSLSTTVQAQVSFGDEIIVTSQKREQNIKDVPLAITAYSQDQLEELGVQQFDDLADFIPGLEVQEQSANNPGFVIRGITSDSGDATIEPRVSIYQDGVAISRSRGSFVEVFDSSVEVARGPQPTLFGRSALIGAINVTSNRPDYSEFSGKVRVGAGNYDYKFAEGFVNIPLEDKAAIRFSGRYKKRDGYIENATGGEDFNGFDTYAARISLGLRPTDDLEFNLIANYQEDDNPGTAFKSGTFLPTIDGSIDPSEAAALNTFGGFQEGRELGLKRSVLSLTGLTDWALNDKMTLSSVTNYRTFDSSEIFDPDGFGYELFVFAENSKSEQFSQEFRLGVDMENGLSGFIGGSYFTEEGSQSIPLAFNEVVTQALLAGYLFTDSLGVAQNPLDMAYLPTVNVNPASPLFGAPLGYYEEMYTNFGDTESYDLFADGTYTLTDRLSVTAGLRYTADQKTSGFSAESTTTSNLTGVGLLLGTGTYSGGELIEREDSFDGVTWRVAANYDVTDAITVFANHARGRRPEVISYDLDTADLSVFATGQLADTFTTLPSEDVSAYEMGVKGSFLDGRIYGDASVYSYAYENFQSTIVDDAGQVEAINAGNASAMGFETSLFAKVSEAVELYGVYAYTNATFDDEDDDGNAQVYGGNSFRLTPKNAVTVGGKFSHEGDFGHISFSPTYAWKSKVFFDNDNDLTDTVQDEFQESYGLLDLRLTYQTPNERVGLEFFVENALDKEYLLDAGNTGDAFGIPTFIAGPPALYGATLTTTF